MLHGPGLQVESRDVVTVWAEWPDLDTTVRALTAAGPSWPAIAHARSDRFAHELRNALAPFDVDDIGPRLPNEFGYITGTRA